MPFAWHPHDDLAAHFDWLLGAAPASTSADLVVLARYMRILPPRDRRRRSAIKIINIHPSLLPYFPGAAPYKQAFECGVRVHGCTAHFVTEQLDEGPVILQDVFHINVGTDTLDDVKEKGLGSKPKRSPKPCSFSSTRNWSWSRAKSSSSRASAASSPTNPRFGIPWGLAPPAPSFKIRHSQSSRHFRLGVTSRRLETATNIF